MANIKLGYAPTRRSIFSAPDAIKYRGLTADRLTKKDFFTAMTRLSIKLLKNLGQKRLMVYSCHIAISVQSLHVQGLRKH